MARDPLRKLHPPSAKQKTARDRNWRVWRLRGLWWNSHPMTGDRLIAYRAAIDDELRHLRAEPETKREARLRAEAERYERFRKAVIGNIVI